MSQLILPTVLTFQLINCVRVSGEEGEFDLHHGDSLEGIWGEGQMPGFSEELLPT